MSPAKKVSRKVRRGYGSRRSLIDTIARERIQILLDSAGAKARDDEDRLARRYVELAQKISTRTKVRIPRQDKLFICKNCLMPLIPGRNARVRLSKDTTAVTITCLSCQTVKRYPYSREKRTHKTVNPYMTRAAGVKEIQIT